MRQYIPTLDAHVYIYINTRINLRTMLKRVQKLRFD